MGYKITGMTLKNLMKRPVTKRYPFEPQVYTSRTRGHIKNDIDTCILCGICVKTCPGVALAVDKPAATWTINPFSCVQCMACVRVCPKKCLTMEPEYTPVAGTMSSQTLTKPASEE